MNNINFNNGNGFPLTANTLDFMQNNYRFASNSIESAIFGNQNLILEGCRLANVNSQSGVTNGVIRYDGEILPFVGGAGNFDTGCIIETRVEQAANRNGQLVDRYTTRTAKFGNGNGFRLRDLVQWNSLSQSLRQLAMSLQIDDVVIISGCDLIQNLRTGSAVIGHTAGVCVSDGQFFAIPETIFANPNGCFHTIGNNTLTFEPDTSQRIAAVRRRQAAFLGEIRTVVTDSSAHFDESGRGLGDYFGWAVANGANGTIDLRGRFLRGAVANQSLGSLFGNDEIRLEIANLPNHNHNQTGYGLVKRSNAGESVTVSGVDATGSGNEPNIVASPANMGSVGNNEPFSILPSSAAVVFIQRI